MANIIGNSITFFEKDGVLNKQFAEIHRLILNNLNYELPDAGEWKRGNSILNALYPMPDSLKISKSNYLDHAYNALYEDWRPVASKFKCKTKKALLKELGVASVLEAKIAKLNEEAYGFRDWYSWRNEYYGTKSDPSFLLKLDSEDDDRFTVVFDTAWAPPFKWLEFIRTKYPDVLITSAWSE